VVKLLAYISDKDLFAEFYRKRLARRLLQVRPEGGREEGEGRGEGQGFVCVWGGGGEWANMCVGLGEGDCKCF